MDLCLHPPSHMCPLTSLCLCCTRLRIFEPLLKEIVQLSDVLLHLLPRLGVLLLAISWQFVSFRMEPALNTCRA